MDDIINQDNLKRIEVDYREAWLRYKEENKKRSKGTKINTEAEFKRVIKGCFRQIAHLWSNSTGGIYMKGLGYFTLLRPIKKLHMESSVEYSNNIFRTSGYSYLLTHVTNLREQDSLGGFKVRRAYRSVKANTKDNILKGRRYTMNSTLIKEYIKRKQYL